MAVTDFTIRQMLEAAVRRCHEEWREELRSKGAIFTDQLNRWLAAELSRSLASLDAVVASLEAWSEMDTSDVVH